MARAASALLEIEDLDAFYGQRAGRSRTSPSRWATSASRSIGRNGMGKTTLCNAIMGIDAAARDAARSASRAASSLGKPSYKIAGAGIGYVPQGRRLFPSLTVDEHLRMVARGAAASALDAATRVYELFPRLAERKRNGGDAALRRRAADARDRPRAARRTPSC